MSTANVHSPRAGLANDFLVLRKRLESVRNGESPAVPFEPESVLVSVADVFGLTPAGVEILGLAAAAELDPETAELMSAMTNTERPTVALGLSVTGDAGWDSICPDAPLRRWRLIEPVGATSLIQQQLVPDERVLHHLMDLNYLDTRLVGLVRTLAGQRALSFPEAEISNRISELWLDRGLGSVVLLAGTDHLANREVAVAAAAAVGQRSLVIRAADTPTDWTQRFGLATFLDREMAMSNAALIIECDSESSAAAADLADALLGPVVLSAEDPPSIERRPRLRIDVQGPTMAERRTMWSTALADRPSSDGTTGSDLSKVDVDRLAEQFVLDRSSIDLAIDRAGGRGIEREPAFDALWHAAREQSRNALDGLADRIDSKARWDDLVLPAEAMAQLHDLASHVREAWRVNREWGWAERGVRGLGAAALFAGPSGTGKTLAAEVVAGELGLDLYRIDLSQVVSKWIGETEKNLAQIFTAAETGGAILLFDEADALFGKRSEVKDSHDRYANVEVSYLLQRMESYSGLAILTTNLRSSLDRAFLRRLRYIVTFPFPDASAREQIWERIFPAQTPTDGLDPKALGRLNIAGGSIRSIALNATFLAAAAAETVSPQHVLAATRREFAKLEKPLSNSEIEALR